MSKIPLFFSHPLKGNIIAFHQPGYGLLIKRVEEITSTMEVIVTGSHPESVDSRTFGPVRQSNILGKVIWHIRKP